MKDIKLIMENWREFLEEAMIQKSGNRYFYINVKQVQDYTNIIDGVAEILQQRSYPIKKDDDKDSKLKFLDGRLFCTCDVGEEEATFKIYFVKEADGITREDIKKANDKNTLIGNMESADSDPVYKYVYTIKTKTDNIKWAHVGPEQIKAEQKALAHIKKQFIKAGFLPIQKDKKDKKGEKVEEGKTATIIIKSSQSDSLVRLEGVAWIEKVDSNDCVGDFEFLDINGNTINYTYDGEDKPFLISHKAVPFLRYAGIKSTLRKLENINEIDTSVPNRFINKTKAAFVEQVLQEEPKRTKKGFWSFAEDGTVIYLIYGATTKKASCVVIGDMTLTLTKKADQTENKEREYTLTAEERIFIYPEIPKEEDYKPIYRSYYGSEGSTISVDKGTENDKGTISYANKHLNFINKPWVEKIIKLNWNPDILTEKDVKSDLGKIINLDEERPVLESLSLPVRFFISPYSNRQGGEELDLKQND